MLNPGGRTGTSRGNSVEDGGEGEGTYIIEGDIWVVDDTVEGSCMDDEVVDDTTGKPIIVDGGEMVAVPRDKDSKTDDIVECFPDPCPFCSLSPEGRRMTFTDVF